MRSMSRWLLAIVVCGFSFLKPVAQDCPARPVSGTVVADPYSITSQNGTLTAKFSLGHSVDSSGYTHYCYRYQAPKEVVEAPTLRVNPGDVLDLNVIDGIKNTGDEMKMDMAPPAGQICGDGGLPTINSTNVHFHGMNVPPVCHQDGVVITQIPYWVARRCFDRRAQRPARHSVPRAHPAVEAPRDQNLPVPR